jgi:sulfopyruvate decarboxylase subunit alpha
MPHSAGPHSTPGSTPESRPESNPDSFSGSVSGSVSGFEAADSAEAAVRLVAATGHVAATGLIDDVFAAGFDFITGVPDSGLADFLEELEGHDRVACYVPGTREDNCVALAVGSYLAGATPLVFMKSAGLGTCIDALTSLALVYRIPLVLLVSWAGYDGRDIPHHNIIGQPASGVLRALGIPVRQCRFAEPAGVAVQMRAALREARRRRCPVAVLGVPEGL